MDARAVEVEVAPVDPELAKAEPDGQRLVEHLASLVPQGHDHGVEVARRVEIPTFGVGPGIGKRDPPAGVELAGKSLDDLLVPRDLRFERPLARPGLGDVGVERDRARARRGDDVYVFDRLLRRLTHQPYVAGEPFAVEDGLAADHPLGSHENVGLLFERPGGQEHGERLRRARPDEGGDVQLPAGEELLARLLAIDPDPRVRLHHGEVQQDPAFGPGGRHVQRSLIPGLIQATQVLLVGSVGREDLLRVAGRLGPDPRHFEPAPTALRRRRFFGGFRSRGQEPPKPIEADPLARKRRLSRCTRQVIERFRARRQSQVMTHAGTQPGDRHFNVVEFRRARRPEHAGRQFKPSRVGGDLEHPLMLYPVASSQGMEDAGPGVEVLSLGIDEIHRQPGVVPALLAGGDVGHSKPHADSQGRPLRVQPDHLRQSPVAADRQPRVLPFAPERNALATQHVGRPAPIPLKVAVDHEVPGGDHRVGFRPKTRLRGPQHG